MLKKKSLPIIGILILIGFFLIGGPIISRNFFNKTKSRPAMYAYSDIYEGKVKPVYIVKKKKDREKLSTYYQNVKRNPHKSKHHLGFKPHFAPLTYPVYIIEYSTDSLFAKVIFFNSKSENNTGGDYTKGYILTETLHSSPPPREQLNDFINQVKER